jgi:predicted RND superfamily exporter protein
MVTFRSFKVGLFSMIPNVWPLVAVFGVIGLTQYTVNLSVAVVGMITLGIAVDDTVYFLSKYLLARKKGLYGADAFAYSFRLVGAPLIFTSLILVAGFGSLTFSDFALNSDMGMLCSAVIALALAADLILLPAMILVFEKKEE